MGKLGQKLSRLGDVKARGVLEGGHACVGAERSGEEGKLGRLSALRKQMDSLSAKLDRDRSRARAHPRAGEFEHVHEHASEGLPGEALATSLGPLRRVLTYYESDHRHGSAPVALALSACPQALSVLALDPTLTSTDLSRALYLDTETTGLLGGTGTLPFLIGSARFQSGCLMVEQWLLERPGLEAPMLSRLAELLSEASCIVSFNGKSFDWPLLRTRFIMNRIAAPKVPVHLDLLHCARRVYKRRLKSVRLVELEASLLGFERVEDLPGELIPETYLGYLRGRTPGAALWPVVSHNRSDLVALPALLGEMVQRFGGHALIGSGMSTPQDARDQLGFAQVAARAMDHQRALAFAEGVVACDVRGELVVEATYLAGTLKLKAGDLHGAAKAFQDSLEAAGTSSEGRARAHLALAKLWEHQLKDLERAAYHAQHTGPVEGAQACQRRVSRLQRKWQLPFGTLDA